MFDDPDYGGPGDGSGGTAIPSPADPTGAFPSPAPNSSVEPAGSATTFGYDLLGRDSAWHSLGFGSRSQDPGWFQYSETDAVLADQATTPGPLLRPAGPQEVLPGAAYIEPDRELTTAFLETVRIKVDEYANERLTDALVKLFIEGAETGEKASAPELWLITKAVEYAVENLRAIPEAGVPADREFEDAPKPAPPVPSPRPGPVADNADPTEPNHWLFLP